MLNWRDPRNPLAGGAERVSLAFMRGLIERGHTVDWVAYTFAGAAPEEVLEGIRIRRAGRYFRAVGAAIRWARRQPPFDLVIDQHHGIPWYAPWWSRTRCLAYIHEVLGPVWGAFYRWPTSHLGRWQERWTHRLYGRVPFWVPSESTRTALYRHGVREVHVLPNGVDVEPLPALPALDLADPLRLIVVSRLAPNKRVDHALRAVAVLRTRGRPVQLTVVGDGMMAERLRQLGRDLGLTDVVRFTGFRSEADKMELLQRSHALLHPSLREGWGLNVIEANAMGCPAVVYPVDGLVDSTVDGVTGRVCREETPEAMAEGVEWMVSDAGRFQRVREAAWRRSRDFRWGVVIPRVGEFLETRASGQKLV